MNKKSIQTRSLSAISATHIFLLLVTNGLIHNQLLDPFEFVALPLASEFRQDGSLPHRRHRENDCTLSHALLDQNQLKTEHFI